MKKRVAGLILVAAAILVVAIVLSQSRNEGNTADEISTSPSQPVVPPAAQPVAKVPAHYETAPAAKSLAATLAPTNFFGKTKQAYEVARKIPATLAQLPCYCHCDESVGHKSLHSCFVDEHAASCAVCVDEALLAFQMERSGKTASQIREQIVAQYSMTAH